MNYFELLSTEKDYYEKLTENERRIYIANQEQLSAINTWNDYNVRQFVEVSQLLNELHRLHSVYNDLTEQYDRLFYKENDIDSLLDTMFSLSLSIGGFSSVLRLSCMDECDMLYDYLSKVKMNRFDWLCDNFDIDVLIETLQSHELY